MAIEPSETNRDIPKGKTTSWEDLLEEFCQPDPLSDLIIDVEGHQLHTSKFLLAKVSSKFRQMFRDPGVEQSGILSLPGTGLHAATEFLRWLLPSETSVLSGWDGLCMGLLPDTQNCGCACAGNAGNVFPVTAGKRSRHASRHVRNARAVMHAGIVN